MIRRSAPADLVPLHTLLRAVWDGDEDAVAYHGGGRVAGWVAEEAGQIVGYASATRKKLHGRHTSIGVHVQPSARGRGLGGALWDAVTQGVDGTLKTATSATSVEAVGFLKRRGLAVSVQTSHATIDPRVVTSEQVYGWSAALPADFEVLPMPALVGPPAHHDRARRDLADLHWAVYAHAHEHDPPTAGVLDEGDFLGDDLHPDWLWVARQGRVLAGVSSVRTTGEAGRGDLGWFGVRREFSRDGPALTLALTGLALHSAARGGVTGVTAELDSADPNAVHLLHALPWRVDRVWLTLTSATPAP